MRRGDIWTVAARGTYAGKPRPAVIVQSDIFDIVESVTVVLFTSDPTGDEIARVAITATDANGLTSNSWLMADKIATVPGNKIGQKVGQLSDSDMERLETAMLVFLGMGRRG